MEQSIVLLWAWGRFIKKGWHSRKTKDSSLNSEKRETIPEGSFKTGLTACNLGSYPHKANEYMKLERYAF